MAVRGDKGRNMAAISFEEPPNRHYYSEMSEWGNPTVRSSRKGSEPGELKYLSTLRKRNHHEMPPVVRAKRVEPKLIVSNVNEGCRAYNKVDFDL